LCGFADAYCGLRWIPARRRTGRERYSRVIPAADDGQRGRRGVAERRRRRQAVQVETVSDGETGPCGNARREHTQGGAEDGRGPRQRVQQRGRGEEFQTVDQSERQ